MTDTQDDQFQAMVAAALVGPIMMMTARGVPVQKALRLVTVEILQGTYGNQVWKELGMNQRTIDRWRQERRELFDSGPEIEDEPPAAVLEAFERLETARLAAKAL